MLLLALTSGACRRDFNVNPPRAPGEQSFIVLSVNDDMVNGYAGVNGDSLITNVRLENELLYLSLEEPLLAYGFIPGPLVLDPTGIPLPHAGQTYLGSVRGSGIEWVPQEVVPLPFRDARFQLTDAAVLECLNQGGCWTVSGICERPCQEVQVDPPALPEAPEAPFPPVFGCPEGWAPVDVDENEPARCEPPPLPPRVDCAGAEAQFYGATTCARVAPLCPDGDFVDAPVGVNSLYVLNGANGNGTRESPYGSLTAALLAAAEGTAILIGAGDYATTEEIEKRVSLIGACPERTFLRAGSNQRAFDISDNGSLEIRNATVEQVLLGAASSRLSIQDSVLAGVPYGILQILGESEIEHVVARNADEAFILAVSGTVAVRNSSFDRAPNTFFSVRGADTRMSITDLRIDVGEGREESTSVGFVGEGAKLTAERVHIEAAESMGNAAVGEGTRADFRDLEINILSEHAVTGGAGHPAIVVQGGAEVSVQRARIRSPRQLAMHAERASLTASDVIIEDAGAVAGYAVGVVFSNLTLERAWIDNVTHVGILGRGDAQLEDVQMNLSPSSTVAIGVKLDGALRADRVRVHNARHALIGEADPWDLRDFDVQSRDLEDAYAIEANGGSAVTGRRWRVRGGQSGILLRTDAEVESISLEQQGDSQRTGLFFGSPARVFRVDVKRFRESIIMAGRDSMLSDARVSGAAGTRPEDLARFAGVQVFNGPATLSKVVMEGVDVGVNISATEDTVASDLSIGRVRHGLGLKSDAHLIGQRVAISDSNDSGIDLDRNSVADLSDLRVTLARSEALAIDVDVRGEVADFEVDECEVGVHLLGKDVILRDGRILRSRARAIDGPNSSLRSNFRGVLFRENQSVF